NPDIIFFFQCDENYHRCNAGQFFGFHVASCVRVCEGPVQSKLPQERSGWVRLSGISLCLKRLVSRQIVLWMPCQTVLSRQRITACAFCLGSCYSHIHGVTTIPANAAA